MELKKFEKVVKIIERVKCDFKHYLEAQREGMSFAIPFPPIGSLATPAAERRAIEYLYNKKSMRDGSLTKIEQLPLQQNETYLDFRDKIIKEVATEKEALYVKKLQLSRSGEIEDLVEDYLEQF